MLVSNACISILIQYFCITHICELQPGPVPSLVPSMNPSPVPSLVSSSQAPSLVPSMNPSLVPSLKSPSTTPTITLSPTADPLLELISTNQDCTSVKILFDSSRSDTVTYTELASSSCRACNPLSATKYHLLASDIMAQRGPFEVVLDADRDVECTKSLAFATSISLGKVYSTPLKQSGSMTCIASWYGVFPDISTWSAAEYTVSFAISGLLGNSSPATGGDASLVGQKVELTPTYILSPRITWTVNNMVVPQLVLLSITGAPVAGLTLVYETTVQLALGPKTLGCTFPSSVDIVLGNGGAGCIAENVVATAGVPGEYKWQHVYMPSDITNCGADMSDNNFFVLPMTLSVAYGKHWDAGSLPADTRWCFGEEVVLGARAAQCWGDKAWTRPTLAPGQASAVLISKSLIGASTFNISRVVLDASGYSVAAGCPGVAALFSPMGVPQLTVRAKGASAAEVGGVIWSAVLDGTALQPLSVSDCGDADATTQCAVFAAPGCQPMINFADGSCSFSNEDNSFSVTASTSMGVTKKVLNAGLIFPGLKFSTCSVALTTQNVTGFYQIAFSASREDHSAGISLSQPIVGKFKLLNVNTTGTLSFSILDVTVQLRLSGSNTTLASRTFTRAEKQRLMMSLSSPYYADAHWCRTAASASGICSSFYALYNNPLTSALPAVFGAATTSGYKSCEPLSGFMNEDRFTFTPADWGFDRHAPDNAFQLELRYIINAVFTDCTSAGRRMLNGIGDIHKTFQFEGTHAIAAETCARGKASKTCDAKTCLWTANPTLALTTPDALCYPKTTVGRWACENILNGRACALNSACTLAGKKCRLKPKNIQSKKKKNT